MPKFLYKLISPPNKTCYCSTNAFKYSFFLNTILKRDKLDFQICNAEYFKKFRNNFYKFSRPTSEFIYEIHHPLSLKLLIRLRLGMNHFNDLIILLKPALTYFIYALSKMSELSISSSWTASPKILRTLLRYIINSKRFSRKPSTCKTLPLICYGFRWC